MSALASKVCIMHFLRLLKFYVRLHHFLYKWILRTGEKSFLSFLSCGKVTSFFVLFFFSGTPGFLHSSELKRPVRATRHPLLRSSSVQGGRRNLIVSPGGVWFLLQSPSPAALVFRRRAPVCFAGALFLFRRAFSRIHRLLFLLLDFLLFLNAP